MEFTEFIKKRRDVLELTQEDLAKRLGTATAYVGLIELGKRRPKKVTSLEKLRTALEIEEQDSGWFFRFSTYGEQPEYCQKYLNVSRFYQTPSTHGLVLSEDSPVYQAFSSAIEHPSVNPEHLRQVLILLQTPDHPFSRMITLLLDKPSDILEILLERLHFELQLLEKK
ncbi:MAG: helix-turn-helix transcriptional regulator [Candidatus Vecturithrix sp.]|jgi:transcriptional regulator with XRE-family HTH domain|nr:helix-turn-helix transcriptional regulator [Candidatus Vecturithrix sp.]